MVDNSAGRMMMRELGRRRMIRDLGRKMVKIIGLKVH